MVPLKYGIIWNTYNTTVLVSVYTGDGTVSIAHGGVEIGQGINTKVQFQKEHLANDMIILEHFIQVAQVAANALGIDLNLIEIKPTNSLTNPNGMTTGGSVTSELNCQVVPSHCIQSLKV